MTPEPVSALAALLDQRNPCNEHGDELPPLWHWLFFLDRVPQSELGVDGHPREGGFLPPIPHRRRMFASGRLQLTVDGAPRVVEEVEGFPELVVHGPLLALLLLELPRRFAPQGNVAAFGFRARRPIFAGQPVLVHGSENGGGAWAPTARTGTGSESMTGTVRLR
jgi:hydroxyacyl-ACP dehydratase HTD2-like protein with hotdog domain